MTFRELIRIEEKAREEGLDALESWELDALWDFRKRTAPFFEALKASAWTKLASPSPESVEAMNQWRALPADEQQKYRDWTLRQFYAMKLLIDEQLGREPD